MKYGTLNNRNPCCDASLLRQYDALYRGGVEFRNQVSYFLPKNPLESLQLWALRKRDVAYQSHVGPIIDFYAAQLFSVPYLIRALTANKASSPLRSKPSEGMDDFYGEFKEDVDLQGTDLTTFMRQRFTSALVKRSAWWCAEFPDDEGLPVESREDWESRGLGRARLCSIEAENVLDWEYDRWGRLLWVITYESEFRRADPRQARNLRTETWKLYDAENVETFSVTYNPKERRLNAEDIIPSVSKVPHRFPRVPFVHMCLPEGMWLLNRVAEAQVEHFRLSAALSWAIKRCAYPMLIFKADGQKAFPITGPGLGHTIDVKEEFDWVVPPSDAFEIVAKAIETQKNEIYRVSQQMAHAVDNSASTAGRSGLSKLQDNAATEICLLGYAAVAKDAIERTFELISDGREDFDVHFSIEGMDAYNLDAVSTTLTNIKTAQSLSLPSPTLKKEMALRAADLLVPDASQQVKDSIREEINSASFEPVALPDPKEDPEEEPIASQPRIKRGTDDKAVSLS